MSLSPTFVLWAALFYSLLLIAGAVGWLTIHTTLLRLLRRLWLADLVAGWLAYAAAYHLAFLTFGPQRGLVTGFDAAGRPAGAPVAVWVLCGLLGLYALLRVLPTPLRRPELLFMLGAFTWALVIAAGFPFIDRVAAAQALLRDHPAQVLEGAHPDLAPLRRALQIARLDEETRNLTARTLATLESGRPLDPAALATFRLRGLPALLKDYDRALAKLRTYQWLQIALLALTLLAWGYGRPPRWETA